MKKLILTVSLVICICIININAQESMFKKGDLVLNGSIGFGSVLFSGLGYATSFPPVAASLEYGILDKIIDKGSIGVGGYVGYSASKFETFGLGYRYSNIIIGARGALHYPFVSRLDTYTGLLLGFNVETVGSIGTPLYANPSSGSRPAFMWFAGGRYYFNRQFAALAEIGYGIAWLNLGISYRIK
jgi:hypothetical protein